MASLIASAPANAPTAAPLSKDHAAIERMRRSDAAPEQALAAVADLTALAVDGIVAAHPEARRADGRLDGALLRALWKRYEP